MKKILVFLFLLFFANNVFAIGMMTEPIVIKSILRGQEATATLNLLNSENKEVVYGLKAEGQIAKWVSFYNVGSKSPITEIKIPNDKFIDVKVKFSVPGDTPNGKYTGKILVFTSSGSTLKTEETSVNVSQQVSRDVTISVTDKEIIGLETAVIPQEYGIKSGNPLKINLEYFNKGNISLKPNVQLKISKDGKNVFGAIFLYPETEEAIKPGERKTISAVDWQTIGQADGKYVAEIKVLNDDKTLLEKSFEFEIGNFKDVALASSVSSFFKGEKLVLLWFFIGALLLAAAVMLNNLRKQGVTLKQGYEKIRSYFN